mgnify:CR=1 FL=1
MNFRRSASASLRPCRYAAPLRGRPTRSGGGAPSELPDPNRDSPALTRTSNHSKSSTNQQETPQSFNNGWDIPRNAVALPCSLKNHSYLSPFEVDRDFHYFHLGPLLLITCFAIFFKRCDFFS